MDNIVIDSKALEIGSSYVYEGIDIGKIEGVVEGNVGFEKCCFLGPLYFLSIRSLPQGAIIFIDGEERGSTPNEKIGPWFMEEHTLRLKLEGYEDAERTFQFDPDRVEGGILEMEIPLKEIQIHHLLHHLLLRHHQLHHLLLHHHRLHHLQYPLHLRLCLVSWQ